MTVIYSDKNSVPSQNNASEQFSTELVKSAVLNVINGSVSAQPTNETATPNATATPTAGPNVTALTNATAGPTAGSNVTTSTNATTGPTAGPNVTATTTPSTNPPTAAEGTLDLTFSLNQSFTSDLADPTSPAYQDLSLKVITEVNRVGKQLYGRFYSRCRLKGFKKGSVVSDMTLIFSDKNSVPPSNIAAEQFSTELEKSTVVTVIKNSVSAQATPTTPPTDPPAATEGTLDLTFSLNQTFTSELANSSSPAYQDLSLKVITEINRIGAFLYGQSYRRCLLKRFRNGSVVPDMTLIFSDKNSVPAPNSVSDQFSAELAKSTVLTVINGSVSAQATPTTPPTDPPTATEGTLDLTFRLNQTFTSELANSSSPEYQDLSLKVIREINRIGAFLYGHLYSRSLLKRFRNGSVASDMTLIFSDKNSVPAPNSVSDQFNAELAKSTVLNVINGSVSAQPTTTPAPVTATTSSSPAHHTVGSLAVLSLTLLAVAQMLIDF